MRELILKFVGVSLKNYNLHYAWVPGSHIQESSGEHDSMKLQVVFYIFLRAFSPQPELRDVLATKPSSSRMTLPSLNRRV